MSSAGEIEALMDMKTYMQTVACNLHLSDVLVLEIQHFDRIFVKRPMNAAILASMKANAEMRVRARTERMRGVDRSIPLLGLLLEMASKKREEAAAGAVEGAAAGADGRKRGSRRSSTIASNRSSRSGSLPEYDSGRRPSVLNSPRTSVQLPPMNERRTSAVDRPALLTLAGIRRSSRASTNLETDPDVVVDDPTEDLALSDLETRMKSWMMSVVSAKSGLDEGRDADVRIERMKRPSLIPVSFG